MQFTVKREAGGLCRLHIEFSADEVAEAFAEDADLWDPGEESLAAEAVQEMLVHRGMAQALADAGLETICEPAVLGEKPVPCQGKPFVFEADASVLPDIPLPGDLASLKMPAVDAAPTPYELQEAYDMLTRRAVRLREVAQSRCPRPGDVADVEVEADAEGFPLPELHRRKCQRWLGKAQPEGLWGPLEKALFGLRPGESCELSFPCPQEHADPLLRGRPVRAHVKLVRLWDRLPKDENKLARSLGLKDAKALRGAAAMRAKGKASARSREKAEEMLVDSLLEGLDFHVPQGLIDHCCAQEMQDTMLWYANFQASPGVAARWDEGLALAEREAGPKAVQDARRIMLLLALARRLGLEVSAAELDEAVAGVQRPGEDAAGCRASLEENGSLAILRRGLLAGKALEALCGMAGR